jgi:heme/copper-type cytochrome/quinol oxidase subunit 2
VNHGFMPISVRVVALDEFKDWLLESEANY